MVGAAIKGVSKLLKKGKVKRPRGTPTKAAMMARKNVLRGEKTADKFKQTRGFPTEGKYAMTKAAKKPGFKSGIAAGSLATLAYQEIKKGKKSEAKTTKGKTKKAAEEHIKKDKKKKEKHHSR